MPDEEINDLDYDNRTLKTQLGFVPRSVWYFNKAQTLLTFVKDQMGEGSYGEEKDAGSLSQFNPTVAEKIIRIWSKEDDKILDPFAGRCRALMAQLLNRRYVGYEISPKICAQLQKRLAVKRLETFKHEPQVINADARTISGKEEFDLVFSCPPYWDVEDYNKSYEESTGGQLSDIGDYGDFMKEYEAIIKKCYDALKPEKFAVFVVADIRREKTLYPFGMDTIGAFVRCGFKLHDIIINQIDSLSIMGLGPMIKSGYMPKCHEYILVFRKV